ncbi:NIPSNAP family protein [Tellurirhabdus bombi]|uniref:NIPSNAP family protein n=1 Tax=Tellurirhabdus bombi TaxID=2907205 RepID=UPI001F2C3142|nr:NIPSNAP family protein [Tellurirhabdus bombi]
MSTYSKTSHVLFFSLAFLLVASAIQVVGFAPKREFYQLKIYHLKDDSQQERLEKYLEQAYLPALHRAGVGKVGVFKPAPAAATGNTPAEKLVYLLIPFKSSEQVFRLPETLAKDKQYQTAAQDYINAEYNNPVFSHFETIVMEAFATMPTLATPSLKASPAERVYELRSYEAATEKLHENKIRQFDNGELGIFKRLGFNTIFCGQVKAGHHMPNMMYMTSFENKAERDAHWKAFSADPEWKKLNSLPEYAHNFLRADIFLLHPTAYSEI